MQALARDLVQQGKLTKFQAASVYLDKGKSLIYGDYLVLDRIGAGGMGQVFKARHRRMDRIVALKVMSVATMQNADSVKRFEREVRVAAKLVHSNIVTAYDAGLHDGVHYLVMEYVEGPDLSSLVREQGKLPVKQACEFIAQAARGCALRTQQGNHPSRYQAWKLARRPRQHGEGAGHGPSEVHWRRRWRRDERRGTDAER